MIEIILSWLKGLKPVHWAGGAAGIGAILHVIFWNRVKDAVGDFFSSLGESAFASFKKLNPWGGKKSKRLTGFQVGRLVQKVDDMGRELKAVKKEQAKCNRDRNRCEAKTVYQDKKISNLTGICDTLTRRLLDIEKKIV